MSTLRQAILLIRNADLYLDFANLSFAHDSAQVSINTVSDGIAMQPKAAPLYLREVFFTSKWRSMRKGRLTSKRRTNWIPARRSYGCPGITAAQQTDLDRALANIPGVTGTKTE